MEIGNIIESSTAVLHTDIPGYEGYELHVYDEIEPIALTWDACVRDRNIFLSSNYLRAIESVGPQGLQNYYAFLTLEGEALLVTYCQLKHFNAAESLQLLSQNSHTGNLYRIKNRILKGLADNIDFNALVCGNIMVTGEHAYRLCNHPGRVDEVSIIPDMLLAMRSALEEIGVDVPVIFVKDFFDKRLETQNTCFTRSRFRELVFQPNMILYLQDHWNTLDDYLRDMKSKYRMRAKRARKFLRSLDLRELTLDDIKQRKDEMHQLYREIALGAEFNLFLLPPGYFIEMKLALENNFQVFGYFRGEQLLGFYSLIKNNNEVEAHFLGYKQGVNRSHQLYHNMLIDLVDKAIHLGVERIIFARTALEIKSSVGAVPEPMHCYIRHKNPVYNAFALAIFRLLNPEYAWKQRHPFTENGIHRS